MADDVAIVDRLAAHRTLGSAPRTELEWLAQRGNLRRYAVGEIASSRLTPTVELFILLSGHLAQYVTHGAFVPGGPVGGASGRRKFMEWRGGEVTGLLPYSRMRLAVGDSLAEQPTEALTIHSDHFAEMIRECPVVTATLVHVMLDRSRDATSTLFQDEKMMSLGKLSAGLAHELNNPASAAARSAKLLAASLDELHDASRALASMGLTSAERDAIDRVSEQVSRGRLTTRLSPLERADREDELAEWADRHGAGSEATSALAEAGISPAQLDAMATDLAGPALAAALRWIVAEHTPRALSAELERGASRIHDLVSAVKRFTYMDRATVAGPSSIMEGLTDSATMLTAKARAKAITVTVEVPNDLPNVRTFGGELNQVWANLIDNALDAAPQSGHVAVSAAREGERVVVRIADDGAGIAADVRGRIFDPFFTTKPIGEGTGLGLDIAARIVRRHDGDIEVESRPGRTEFRVALPVP